MRKGMPRAHHPASPPHLQFEFNAYGTVWDLLLVRPYRDGGPPLMPWDTIAPSEPTMPDGPSGWTPITRAVHVDGVLNNGTVQSKGWYVEVALPWTILCQAAQGITCPPGMWGNPACGLGAFVFTVHASVYKCEQVFPKTVCTKAHACDHVYASVSPALLSFPNSGGLLVSHQL